MSKTRQNTNRYQTSSSSSSSSLYQPDTLRNRNSPSLPTQTIIPSPPATRSRTRPFLADVTDYQKCPPLDYDHDLVQNYDDLTKPEMCTFHLNRDDLSPINPLVVPPATLFITLNFQSRNHEWCTITILSSNHLNSTYIKIQHYHNYMQSLINTTFLKSNSLTENSATILTRQETQQS